MRGWRILFAEDRDGLERVMTERSGRCFVRRACAVAAVAFVALVGACADGPSSSRPVGSESLLRENLSVAGAVFAAGQPAVAGKLYQSLAERFNDAPEPLLGLGYIAIYTGDFSAAEGHFLKAAALAEEFSALKAEALLGAGRAALANGRTDEALPHFRNAREPALKHPSAAWIVNGIAVLAALNADYESAEARFGDALRLSSGDPRITANFVRMLLRAGRVDRASEVYGRHDPSYWVDDDGGALSVLIEGAQRRRPLQPAAYRSDTGLTMQLSRSAGEAGASGRLELLDFSGRVLSLPERPGPPAFPVRSEAPSDTAERSSARPVPADTGRC